MDRCGECGFQYDLAEAGTAGAAIAAGGKEVASLLIKLASDGRRRRHAQTWSPLEYACHLRDMLLVQRERVLLARRRDRPSLEPMGRDERVEHDGYARQQPDDVARQLCDAADLFANVLAHFGVADWDRTVMYNHPQLSERSLRWVALHTLHEVRHHLLDIHRQVS